MKLCDDGTFFLSLLCKHDSPRNFLKIVIQKIECYNNNNNNNNNNNSLLNFAKHKNNI